jgi:hypothetical protein
LLGLIDTFWLPTVVLYRSSLVRREAEFFPGAAPSADLEACLRCLADTDFGFVHQILSYERIHSESMSSNVRSVNTYLLDRVRVLREFGPLFLSEAELETRLESLLGEYYRNVVGVAWLHRRGPEFWRLHRERLEELGYSLYGARLAKAVGRKLADLMLNPMNTLGKLIKPRGPR